MSCNTAASSITAAGHEKPTFKVQSGYEKLITSMNYGGIVYNLNHYLGLGPILKLKRKLADTFTLYRN
jgi:hypothetical protein